jgi:hypothetical protein
VERAKAAARKGRGGEERKGERAYKPRRNPTTRPLERKRKRGNLPKAEIHLSIPLIVGLICSPHGSQGEKSEAEVQFDPIIAIVIYPLYPRYGPPSCQRPLVIPQAGPPFFFLSCHLVKVDEARIIHLYLYLALVPDPRGFCSVHFGAVDAFQKG